MGHRILLKRNTLWKTLVRTTEKALSTGAQLPIHTDYEFVEDAGIRFFVRIIAGLQRKDEDKRKREEESWKGGKANPFLPYDEAMHVADISDTHVALLNKYNVVKYHLLIVTRHYEDQETLLTVGDFEALWACMAEYNGLGFYNGGEEAGASQRHKHLQMVPLPLAPEGPEVPIERFFSQIAFRKGLGRIAAYPFEHVFVRIEEDPPNEPLDAAKETFRLYAAMLEQVGMTPPDMHSSRKQSSPYSLLIARKWMLLVPRSREFFDSISINSLGFAGAFLVRNKEQMDLLKEEGPMNALRSVAIST
ncbi:MAG: DUF4922 domain-containing protein [Nitrospirota bacterium]